MQELFKNKWVSLYQTEDGYVYSHETRCNGKTVAVLVVDSTKPGKFLGRFELCPAHKVGFDLYSITGGVEQNDPLNTAIHEIKEEAGYTVGRHEVVSLGTVRPSKSADTVTYLYYVDVAGKIQGAALGDGSKGEEGSYTKWLDASRITESSDPLLSALALRYLETTK